MNRAINKVRLFLCFFSGEDDFIIRKCNARIQISFAIIGLSVILILTLCFISVFFFTEHLFHNPLIDAAIGLLWASLITNLYLLLLYTISPALLPVARKKIVLNKGKKRKIIVEKPVKEINPLKSISFLSRISLITFIAILITQPINEMIFASSVEADNFISTINNILHNEPLSWVVTGGGCLVFLIPTYLKFAVRRISAKSFKMDFDDVHTLKGLKHLREQLPNPTDFENLQKQIRSLKINEVKTSDFYFQKALIEYRIILDEYDNFKTQYCYLLHQINAEFNRNCWSRLQPHLNKLEKISPVTHQKLHSQLLEDLQDEQFEKYEYWADHPFRSSHKAVISNTAHESDLLHDFHNKKS